MFNRHRNEGLPLEGALKSLDNGDQVLLGGGDVAPDTAEVVCPVLAYERSRDRLSDLCYSQVALARMIARTRTPLIGQSPVSAFSVVTNALNQINQFAILRIQGRDQNRAILTLRCFPLSDLA